MEGVYPAGEFWCHCCAMRRDFVVAQGASPDDPECPLECWSCGYVYGNVTEEVDPQTGLPYPDGPRVRPSISREQRQAAREAMLRRFAMTAMVGNRVRREALKGVPRG